MDIDDRLRVNNLINEITNGHTDYFNAQAAKELIALVPTSKQPSFNFQFQKTGPDESTTSGFAPGIGNVEVKDDDNPHKFKTIAEIGKETIERAGQYKIAHDLGSMRIKELFSDTVLDKTGYECQLLYHKITKEPRELQLLATQVYKVPFSNIFFTFSSFQPWKIPSYGI